MDFNWCRGSKLGHLHVQLPTIYVSSPINTSTFWRVWWKTGNYDYLLHEAGDQLGLMFVMQTATTVLYKVSFLLLWQYLREIIQRRKGFFPFSGFTKMNAYTNWPAPLSTFNPSAPPHWACWMVSTTFKEGPQYPDMEIPSQVHSEVSYTNCLDISQYHQVGNQN